MADWEILHEDEDVLVCYKPANLATQSAKPMEKDLESELKNYRAKKGEEPYIGVVHRLDQPVEGVLAFGKTKEATEALTKQLRDKILMKKY